MQSNSASCCEGVDASQPRFLLQSFGSALEPHHLIVHAWMVQWLAVWFLESPARF